MYWTTETINAELDYRRQQAKEDMRRSRKFRRTVGRGTPRPSHGHRITNRASSAVTV